MIEFKRFIADNGLIVLVHEDRSTPLVAVNLLYNVGSKDEDPDHTGLAHLFEHLMFSGTKRIPNFDIPIQLAGGENNAFTNTDITNYYITVPKENIETALWLESDRMEEINLSKRNIDVQKSVVTEEYKERYLNQPYGDVGLLMRKMAYTTHHYKWPTIGADISHVQNVDYKTITDFYYSHYAPNNAILCISGNITADKSINLVNKWFGHISQRQVASRNLPMEPKQTEHRELTVEKDVPTTLLQKAWHGSKRGDIDFHILDMITDLMAGGSSGYLQKTLVRDKKLFSDANIYVSSEIEPGLINFSGRLLPGVDIKVAEEALNEVITHISTEPPSDYDIEKVKNRYEANTILNNTNILNKALNLSIYELLGDPSLINNETKLYRSISKDQVVNTINKYFIEENCNTLYYLSKRDKTYDKR